MITLWAKTKNNAGIKGVAAMTTYPLYLNTRNPAVKSIKDFSERDEIAVPSIKVSTQVILLQMAAAKIYPEQAKDTKNSVEDIFQVINNPDYKFTLTPQKVQKTAEFMFKIGSIKEKPGSWRDLFFPEIHQLQGD